MVSIPETAYQELEDLFSTLKSISQRPTGNKDAHSKALLLLNEQFEKMITRLDELLQTVTYESNPEDWVKLTVMKSTLRYEEGKIRLGADQLEAARKEMFQALTALKGFEAHALVSYLYMRIVNHLGFILSRLEDFEGAKEFLNCVLKNEMNMDAIPFTTEELFTVGGCSSDDSQEKLHSIYINNLQMLSWVYSKMDMEFESIKVQHIILEKEMEFGDCDPVDWASRCTRVASLYLVRRQFVASRYYLSAASSALDRVESRLIDHPDLGRAQAELARGWIYYGLKLFDMSRAKNINQMCSKIFDEVDVPGSRAADADIPNDELDDSLLFHNSEVHIANVPAKAIQKVQDARHLFQHTQVWLKRARVFYTLRDYPFIYVNCVLDLSELFRYLAFYEADLEAQYTVHKKRANALETLSTILKEVRPQCYIAVSLDLLRELAEVQIELLGINLKKMYKMQNENEKPGSIKSRMESIYQIHSKLENIGNFMNHGVEEENTNGYCSNTGETDTLLSQSQSDTKIISALDEVHVAQAPEVN